MKKPDGGPAFPRMGAYDEDQSRDYDTLPQQGMTLRQFYAAMAMQAFLSSPERLERALATSSNRTDNERVAAMCFVVADALIAFEENEGKK